MDPTVSEAKVTPNYFFSFLLSATSNYSPKTHFLIQSYLFNDIRVIAVNTGNSFFLYHNFNMLIVSSQYCFIHLVIRIIRMNEYSFLFSFRIPSLWELKKKS